MRKFKYKLGDEEFKNKTLATKRRDLLNMDAKRQNKQAGYLTINIQQRVLKGRSGYLLRPFSIKKGKL